MLLGVGGLRQDSRQFPPLPRDGVRTVTNLLYPPPVDGLQPHAFFTGVDVLPLRL